MTVQDEGRQARNNRGDLARPARHMIMGLSAQFLLGMGLSLIGQPAETTGAAHAVGNVLLTLHVLLGAGLVVNAVMVLGVARTGSDPQRRQARWSTGTIALTFAAGALTLMTRSDWWSYAMATGFITSLGLYVNLLVQASGPDQRPGG